MSKKKKDRKKLYPEKFESDILGNELLEYLFKSLKEIKSSLDVLITDLELSEKIKNIDELYSLTIQINDRNLRLLATMIVNDNNEEKEKKISLLNYPKNKKNSQEHFNLIKLRRVFYSYRHLITVLEELNPNKGE